MWSFRLVDPELQRRYFERRKIDWKIDRNLRKLVSFSCVNLVTDNFPNIYTDINNMDLILCRNVFVYFEDQYISQVLRKFAKTLRPGGYLMTGHAEVHNHVMHDFKPKVFSESVVYQAKNVPGEEPGKIESLIASASKPSSAFGESGKGGEVDYDSRQLLPRRTVLASFANGKLADMGADRKSGCAGMPRP